MKLSKRGKKKSDTKKIDVTNTHLPTLHQRLYHAFNLGFRYSATKEKEWHSNDVEIQRLVFRSMSSFLDAIAPETWQMSIVKDSIPDMVRAISGILLSPNEAVLTMGLEVAVKLIGLVPISMLQPHFNLLSHSFSLLLSNDQPQVAIMSASALNFILSNLSVKNEKEVWKVLEKYDTLAQLIDNLKAFSMTKPIEYSQEMVSLLSSILHLWPHTRYSVWSDAKLMEVVETISNKSEASVKVTVLRLYSALALCAKGAEKLLENGEVLIQTIVRCMDKSQPYSVCISAFKFAQNLMATEKLCSEVLKFCCEPIIKSIISALTYSSANHGEISNEDVSLMVEACRLALITQWPGKHHNYLWKFKVDEVLVNLMTCNLQNHHSLQQSLSIEELLALGREVLSGKFFLELRPYVWEIIGLLSAQYEEDFGPTKHGNQHFISLLVATSCLATVDSIGKERLLCQADRTYTYRSISAIKATLMMMYSPSQFISSKTRLLLSETLKNEGEEHLKQLLNSLNFVFSGDSSRIPDKFQLLINLMSLTLYSGLPEFYRKVVRYGGLRILFTFVRWWLQNASHIELCLISHLKVTAIDRTCCRIGIEEWEGKEVHLIMILLSLAELMNSYESEDHEFDIFARNSTYTKDQFIRDIQNISLNTTSNGVKWYCSYVLSFFGFYGFPDKLGSRVSSIFDKDHGDISLILRDGQSINVHQVILLIRCPSLLPRCGPSNEEKMCRSNSDISVKEGIEKCQRTMIKVNLSSQVDYQALSRLLDFVYSGFLQADRGVLRNLRIIAKYCNIQPLVRLLCRKRPKWGAHVPCFDLTGALGPDGHVYSDVILEAKSNENANWTCNCCSLSLPECKFRDVTSTTIRDEIAGWNCSFCVMSSPHIHAHRPILSANCDYLRALFQSGMQESQSESLKVPVSWEALQKIVTWLYSNNIPKPPSGCLWAAMNTQQKISELKPYIQLCWLGEFWFLDDVQKECSNVVTTSLDSSELTINVIEYAATYSQWELVEIAVNRIAPVYRRLHSCGALDVLDEALVESIRVASVRLSQE